MLLIHYRYRVDVAKTISEDLKQNWKKPSIGNIHWDGKLMKTLTSKYEKVDWLPVLVSGKLRILILILNQLYH